MVCFAILYYLDSKVILGNMCSYFIDKNQYGGVFEWFVNCNGVTFIALYL